MDQFFQCRVLRLATAVALILAGYALPVLAQGPIGSNFSALPESVIAPRDNPTTPGKVALGRLLFWDPVLSGNGDVSCATCHHPDFGYAENIDLSIGVNGVGLGLLRHFVAGNSIPLVKRNSQSVLNTAFNGIDTSGSYDPAAAPMFWDSRTQSLESQALLPIQTLEEMRGTEIAESDILPAVLDRLRNIPDYSIFFQQVFGQSDAINAENLGKALASFQRTLVANNSPFDRYMRGDTSAMTAEQLRGMRAFDRVGCIECHSGPMFSDYQPHVLGVPDNRNLVESDTGIDQAYAFRTPSLRNLAYTAPYMHSGVLADLDDVLDFYDDGRGRRGRTVGRNELDPLFQRLRGVDNAEDEISAFLGALNDDVFDRTVPSQVPSGLQPGGRLD